MKWHFTDILVSLIRAQIHGPTTSSDWTNILRLMILNENVTKRRAILLSACGTETYSLIKKLVAPALQKEKTYKQITDIVKDYHEPKPSAIVERYRFHTRVRKSDESVAEFVAALRGIARNCEFTDLEDQLRDRLVVGINIEAVQRRLLAEPKLTFKSAYEISQAMEVAAKNTLDIRGASGSDRMFDDKTIHKMRQNVCASDAAEHLPEHLKNKCLRCGAKHNFSQPCPHRNTICNFCKKRGHNEKVCFAKRKSSSKLANNQKNHKMQADEDVLAPEPLSDASLFFDHSEYDLFYNEGGDNNKMVSVTVGINSQPVTLEVDTGASLTLISTDTFQKLRQQTPVKLDSVNTTLRTYTGEAVPLMGKCNVTVTYRDTEYVLTIHVVKGNGPNLMGRDWIGILPLNWSELFHVTVFLYIFPLYKNMRVCLRVTVNSVSPRQNYVLINGLLKVTRGHIFGRPDPLLMPLDRRLMLNWTDRSLWPLSHLSSILNGLPLLWSKANLMVASEFVEISLSL